MKKIIEHYGTITIVFLFFGFGVGFYTDQIEIEGKEIEVDNYLLGFIRVTKYWYEI